MDFKLSNKNRVRIISTMTDLDIIRREFTAPNPNYKYSHFSQPYISPITPLGSFQIGMFDQIYKYTQVMLDDVNVDEEIFKIAYPQHKLSDKIVDVENNNYQYYEYQQKAIQAALNAGRGIILLPTRAGKSLVIYGVFKNSKINNMLIVVPNIQLVKQMQKDLIEYGYDKTHIQVFSGHLNSVKQLPGITVTNSQYLLKHAKELPNFDMIIVDECHQLKKGNKISDWLKKQNANVIYGYTGTLPESQEDVWNVNQLIGPVIYQKQVHDLQQKKYLAEVKMFSLKFMHKNKPRYVVNDYDDIVKRYRWECGVLEDNDAVNDKILKVAKALPGNTLILFDHIEHGNKLFEMLDYENKCFVDGSVPLDEREDIRERMAIKSGCITIANTKCFGTGITLKQIQNIIFAASGKGVTKIIQSIGRGLERNKTHINIFDTHHNYKYSENHYQRRCELYQKFYNINNIQVKLVTV